ncbi:alpha/beta hydrolase [Aspergillus brunneoviolaceus CBS 621.78]|uniref:Alpha/beta-hydrolase n=1 Tax=Aspergillus brunneoviolaceus CBS 621.78 TaxID=1450534 RepID=A0ACD1GNB3_9EURO|nr:alpha/beta-hydrolase [Aspergillus brunneoviolaceus CBS 621.78]RAH50702.1 alpha/beta-hydrolase [Aspergillus brunneoviolaceus CBS 621.78]
MAAADVDAYAGPLAQFFAHGLRSPILRRPGEEGLQYEEVWFPSLDGVVLEGWLIPAKGSNKLIIANLPGPPPRDNKALHDAGYNVLCYDLRNHGRSGAGSGGIVGIGLFETRDVVGSIQYARSRPDTAHMEIGLLGRCLGANSTSVAFDKFPGYLKDVKALIVLQPVFSRVFVEVGTKNAGLDPKAAAEAFETKIFHMTGLQIDELTPIPYTKAVTVPTLVAQVHRDVCVVPDDVQAIYDGIGAREKELFWIEGTTRRFDGYNYFGEHPERMLQWFNKYMS